MTTVRLSTKACGHLSCPADCGIPVIINGSVNYTTTVEGSITTYQCDTGLIPEGVVTAECMENEEWAPDPAEVGCRLPGRYEILTLFMLNLLTAGLHKNVYVAGTSE